MRREVTGCRGAGNIGLACTVDGDAITAVVAAPSDVGGIQQRVPGAVQFENKYIHAAGVFSLERTKQREVERVCPSRNIGVPVRIGRDSCCGTVANSSHIGTVGHHRINDERNRLVERPQFKTDHALA